MQPVSGSKLLVIAVVCGALASGAAWMYLKSKEAQYRNAYKPPVERKVAVVVPRNDLGKSEVMSKEKVAVLEVPAQFVPSGAVLAQDWKKLEGRMVTATLQKGKPITWSSVEGNAVSRFSENVELGKRAKTVKISKINSFDGLLRPGDHIDLLGSFAATDIGLQKQVNFADDVVMSVLENVVVLAAGREDAGGRKYETFYDQNSADGFNMNFSTISLMLSPQQVARVELAERSGDLVAVLRHPKDTSTASLGQITVSNLLDPPPLETVDVVLDATGNPVGRIVGDNVVDAQGRIVGKVIDGKPVDFDGKSLGQVVADVGVDDPLLRARERTEVVRDAAGNVVGRVIDGQVLDADGKVIGQVKNGKAVGLDGQSRGQVRTELVDSNGKVVGVMGDVVRDANGQIIGRVVDGQVLDANGQVVGQVTDGQAVGLDGKTLGAIDKVLLDNQGRPTEDPVRVVRDASGNAIGTVKGDTVYDAEGKAVGKLVDGKVVDANGAVLAADVSIGLESQAMASTTLVAGADGGGAQSNRTVQFIPGGTAKGGLIPVQSIRME